MCLRKLRAEALAWEQRRNQDRCRIDWKFTRQDDGNDVLLIIWIDIFICNHEELE